VSALKGSLSYTRFFVNGELPADFRGKFGKAIRLRAMKPLSPDEEAMERSGWCVMAEPFETELAHGDVFWNEFVNLGFRTDKWAIPGPLLRSKVKEAETAALARKGRERLTRTEKNELKELVVKKLRRQLPPVTRTYDLSWSLDDGLVRFFSHADRTIAGMRELFERTFGLELVAEAPYTLAARLGLSRADEGTWQALEESNLFQETP
jgi:recombination associated protein RdgC